ncbi:wax ester synthase-like acyl-CoA acyltransferase domain-containing protein [Trametes gibbosa]|nr:wax ester synthase-like acyl-CoA acyltransferase domain-containing protein [Trametes gibbosa]
MPKQNGHLSLVAPEGSPDTPASYYYDEGDARPPAPEDIADKLRRSGRQDGAAARLARIVRSEVTERQQAIGGVDHAWVMLSDATGFNPACTSVFTLRDHVTLDMLAEQMTKQYEKFPRYRQRLASTGRMFHGAVFVDDPDFDVYEHIRVEQLPEPAGKRELDELVGGFIAEPWDLDKQLFQTILVQNYHDENGAVCAVIAKGHHTLADGQGFIISQLYMTSYYDDLREMMDNAVEKLSKAKRGLLPPSEYTKSLQPLDSYASNHPAAPFVQVLLGLVFWVFCVFSTLKSVFWSTYQALRLVLFFFFTFWRIEMVVDNQSGSEPRAREYSSSRVFSMQDIKLCQQAFSGVRPGAAVAGVPREQRKNVRSKVKHVTLNDVVCSIMVDVLASEIERKPTPWSTWSKIKREVNKVLPSPVPFFVPISIREPGDWSMRNLSTGSNVYLYPSHNLRLADTSVRDIYAHIHACRHELALFKHSAWPKVCFHILQLTGQAPVLSPLSWFPKSKEDWLAVRFVRNWVIRPVANACMQSFTGILTNIPGPSKKPITMAGVEVAQLAALPPQGGAGTVAIGVISYAGGISIAVSADAVPGSEGVARSVCAGFEARFGLYVERAREVLEHQD